MYGYFKRNKVCCCSNREEGNREISLGTECGSKKNSDRTKQVNVPGLVENVKRKKYRKGKYRKKIEREKHRKKNYIEGKYRKGKCGKHDGGNKMKRSM